MALAFSKDDNLAHARWDYKYHIIFTSKYGRRVIYGELRNNLIYVQLFS